MGPINRTGVGFQPRRCSFFGNSHETMIECESVAGTTVLSGRRRLRTSIARIRALDSKS